MTYQPARDIPPARRRDRYQVTVAALTGLAAAGSLTATGWIAGQTAHAWSTQQAAAPATPPPGTAPGTAPGSAPAAAPQPAAQRSRAQQRKPRVVVRARPTRTRVSTRYVTPAAPVGGGGSVSSTPSHTTSHSSPPAPSSGS